MKSDASIWYPLVDGGVYANNPALCAYAEARAHAGKTASEMVILSLGTGSYKKSYPYSDAKDWGLMGWAKPVLDIMMSGVAETVGYQLGQIYQAIERPNQYLRIQAQIPASNSEMDNAEQENLDELKQLGTEAAIAANAQLSKLVKLLL